MEGGGKGAFIIPLPTNTTVVIFFNSETAAPDSLWCIINYFLFTGDALASKNMTIEFQFPGKKGEAVFF